MAADLNSRLIQENTKKRKEEKKTNKIKRTEAMYNTTKFRPCYILYTGKRYFKENVGRHLKEEACKRVWVPCLLIRAVHSAWVKQKITKHGICLI